jgi:hypothetical protein
MPFPHKVSQFGHPGLQRHQTNIRFNEHLNIVSRNRLHIRNRMTYFYALSYARVANIHAELLPEIIN